MVQHSLLSCRKQTSLKSDLALSRCQNSLQKRPISPPGSARGFWPSSSTMHSSTGPEDVDMDTFSDSETRCHGPPPHIAARFYSKSGARRKSSAHSSRRSSLSSLHSRHSALSAHGGPYSTHIAQHLRRASIIESRKARLADQAAHAEQVRLRAAIAKAAPRGSHREERALAAHAAREKLLAEIAARCEEEVRRVKKVAEETKEKKAAEHARLKQEMTEKLAEAARRRSIYQRNIRRPRASSLPSVEGKKIDNIVLRRLNEEAAAKIIQRSWRYWKQHKAMTAFIGLDISLRSVRDMEFEALGRLLSEERILSATTGMLKTLELLDTSGQGADDRGATRVFLSTFLILTHPLQALSNGGKEPQEQDLIAKAQDLLVSFEAIACKHKEDQLLKPARFVERDTLSFSFNNFCSAFHSWKTRDSSALIEIMINQFVELDLILQTVKDDHDGGVADDYFHAIRQNQIQLLVRLKKLAGPDAALSRIRSAVRKARKQRSPKASKFSEQGRPRSSSLAAQSSEFTLTADFLPGSTQVLQASNLHLGTSSFVSRLGQTMTVLPGNREISHEIQINGTYEVQQQPWTDSRKHFMNNLRSSMRQSMSQGGTEAAANWTHSMAILIRDKLLNLVSRKHPLYDRINDFLDPKLIDQTCRAGMFSYDSFFETIAGLVAQTCSPGRDDIVKKFAADTSSDAIDRLFTLINIIDLMTLDHINFAFRAAASAVLEHGHEHERSSFENDLSGSVHTLEGVRRWWLVARSNSTIASGNSIYVRGLVDLVLSNNHLSYAALPETLRLDWLRLLALRARAFKAVSSASVLLTTKIRLRRNRESQWTKDAERLLNLDFAEVENSRIVAVIESAHMMPESTKEGLLNFVSRVLPPAAAAAKNLANAEQARLASIQNGEAFNPLTLEPSGQDLGDVFTEQVATFVLKSLREHVLARLSAVGTTDKVRVTTSAAEVLARAGMPEFVAETGNIVDTLERVKNVDLRAHEKWYDEVAREV